MSLARPTCPQCHRGPVFRGFIKVHDRCPQCGLKIVREPGYFLVAMYFSYAMSVPLFALLLFTMWRITRWPLEKLLIGTQLAFLPFVPLIIRYSRAAWIRVDRYLDRTPESG